MNGSYSNGGMLLIGEKIGISNEVSSALGNTFEVIMFTSSNGSGNPILCKKMDVGLSVQGYVLV